MVSDSVHGEIREQPLGRSAIKVFKTRSLDQLSGLVGYEIRMKRIEAGLTQNELAGILLIQRSHLSDIERGIHMPNQKNRMAIEQLLNLKIVHRIGLK